MYFALRKIKTLIRLVAAFEVLGLAKSFNTLVLSESANG